MLFRSAQTIEKSAYQHSLQVFEKARLLFLRESEGGSIASVLTRCFSGSSIKSRKQERLPVKVSVMLKKSQVLAKSPTGGAVQFLREGEMKDFSQGGALITIPEGRGVHPKDFLSLMYQDQKGKWVSVESQVRWVASTSHGEQIIGVQFLAVSA